MEAVSLLFTAVVLVIGGCAATVLSALTVPVWIRVRGQPHGRFAGLLGAHQGRCVDGGGVKRRVDGSPGRTHGAQAAHPIAA